MDGITPDVRERATGRLTMATTTLRKCVGSARFGIEAHQAPIDDFPVQPSQPDGLGRMCRKHWKSYVAGLRKDAQARKVEVAVVTRAQTRSIRWPGSPSLDPCGPARECGDRCPP